MNLRAQHAYLTELLDDVRVSGGIGVGLPSPGMTAEEVVQYWNAPDEFMTAEQVAMRERLRDAFVGNDATMISLQLVGA